MVGGCQTATGTGAAAGGAIGAGIGALAGRSPGAALVGGALGAGVGALGGAAVERADDNRARAQHAANVRATTASAPSLPDIVHMAQSNVSDDIIIDKVRASNVVYNLSPDQLVMLKQQGVSDRVVRAMQTGTPRPVVQHVPQPTTVVYERVPVYMMPAPPPPQPMVGIGMRFR